MKKSLFIISLIALGLIVVAPKNYALDAVDEEIGEELKLYLGEAKLLSVSNPTRIVIGNPAVVDVTHVTNSEIALSPKGTGTTTLVIWDIFGEQSYRVRVLAEDTQELKRRIDNLLGTLNLPGVSTRAEDEEGKIFLLGKVKTPQERERLLTALGSLKDKVTDLLLVEEEVAVVEIDVQVLELDKDATTTLGFTWPGSVTLTDASGPTTAAVTGLKRIFHVSDFTRSAFSVTLDALVQEGKARILSRPRLACQSGKEAELLVGGEKPIMTTDVVVGGGTDTNVEYKEYGIKLKIKPTVTEEELIKLALNVEVSDVGVVETLGTNTTITARAYPLTKRAASTELFLNDGQTLSIGGLIRHKTGEDIRKTPWLGDLPILGLLFRKRTTTVGGGQGERGETELFITLTPTIIARSEKKSLAKDKREQESIAKVISIAPDQTPPYENTALYASLVQKRILDNLVYPPLAKQAGFQGTVKLNLRISYLGELLEVKVKESSGHKILDDDALKTTQKITSYPPFPASIEQKELSIDMPLVYRLD